MARIRAYVTSYGSRTYSKRFEVPDEVWDMYQNGDSQSEEWEDAYSEVYDALWTTEEEEFDVLEDMEDEERFELEE